MRNFRKLTIWTTGMDIAKEVYAIPSNIAEGCGKSSDRDFKRYLEISLGSSYELETQVILASNIHDIDNEKLIISIQNEQKMIVSLLKKI